MTDTVVDASMIGTIVASAGTLESITLTKPPITPGFMFTLVDVDSDGNEVDEIFSMQTSSMPFPTGTVFPLYGHTFQNLGLKSISPDGQFTITTSP